MEDRPSMHQRDAARQKGWVKPLSNKSHPAHLEISPGVFKRHHKYIPRKKQAYSSHCIPDYSKCAHRVPLQANLVSTMMLFLQERKDSGVRVKAPRGMTLAPKKQMASPVTSTV